MLVKVRVNPHSKEEKIEHDGKVYHLFFNMVCEKGKANKKVIAMISRSLSVPKSNIKIKRGFKSRDKLLEISHF